MLINPLLAPYLHLKYMTVSLNYTSDIFAIYDAHLEGFTSRQVGAPCQGPLAQSGLKNKK